MSWIVVCDSSADIYSIADLPEGIQYTTVPMKIRVNQREFVDTSALDTEKMLEAADNYNGASSTACPGPEEWAEKFMMADNAVAITISSNLSGSYNSACAARDMILEEHPEKNIIVVDSLSCAGVLYFLAERAIECITLGQSPAVIAADLELWKKQTRIIYVLSCFDNLVKNGRMSRLAGFVAGALGMRGAGRASEQGTIEIYGKCRGETRSLAMVLEEMDNMGYDGKGKVIVDHVHNEKAAQMLERGILNKWPQAPVTIGKCGGLCSFYAQKGGLIISYQV